MQIENMEEKFDRLFKNCSSENFLKMNSLGGEIPFYIVTYPPNQENEASKYIKKLTQKLKLIGISTLNIDLFDLIIEIMQEENKLSRILEVETRFPKKKFIENLKRVLDINSKIIPKISKQISETYSKVVFLTGAGECFPIFRSHYILKNLESKINIPTILFFPGIYDGKSLNLFGKMKDGNHYRAFNLDKINF